MSSSAHTLQPILKKLSITRSHHEQEAKRSLVYPQENEIYQTIYDIEDSYDKLLSAIGRLVGRLFIKSQSYQDLSFVIEQSAARSKDFVFIVENTLHRLKITHQAAQMLIGGVRKATQSLVSIIHTQGSSRNLDDPPLRISFDLEPVFSFAMTLIRVASRLSWKAHDILQQINEEYQLYRQVSVSMGVASESHMLSDLERPISDFSIPPTRSTSLGQCSVHYTSAEPFDDRSTYASIDFYSASQKLSQNELFEGSSNHDQISGGLLQEERHVHPRMALTQACEPYGACTTEDEVLSSVQAERRINFSRLYHGPNRCKTLFNNFAIPETASNRAEGVHHGFNEKLQTSKESTQRNTFESLSSPEIPPKLSFDENQEVIGGTLSGFVEYLTSQRSICDTRFKHAFYLSFRLFCTPEGLAKQLIDRFHISSNSSAPNKIQLRVGDIFLKWLEVYWCSCVDKVTIGRIVSFASSLSLTHPVLSQRLMVSIQRVRGHAMHKSCPTLLTGEAACVTDDVVPLKAMGHRTQLSRTIRLRWKRLGTSMQSSDILAFDSISFAHQLIVNQMGLFCSIKPTELVGSGWMSTTVDSAPNVRAMIHFTNRLSYVVIETILQCRTKTRRGQIIEHWIKIAQECSNLRNYDGLVALLSGLGHSSIARLHQTWNSVSPTALHDLEALKGLVSPSDNFKCLRTSLRCSKLPCLPFLGMYLTDLVFVDTAHPLVEPDLQSELASGQVYIHFSKCLKTAKIIRQLQNFQTPYQLPEDPHIQQWISSSMVEFDKSNTCNLDTHAYERSLILEPRNTKQV
ncbi:related to Ras guanine-nucleotide exchange protein Cdc25p [Fusarium fujikuroi]|nr:related to Ras guanine-nucleotide exchange protein Cdc25p [Fusarium fujikuroi]